MIREYPKEIEQKNTEQKNVYLILKEDEKMLVYFMVFTLALVGIIGITIAIALKK
jgi:hypothetical protein